MTNIANPLDVIRVFNKLEKQTHNAGLGLGNKPHARNLCSIYLGVLIGKTTPIPAERFKESPALTYGRIYKPETIAKVGAVNEAYPLDIDLAINTAYLVWLERYEIVHGRRYSIGEAIDLLLRDNAKAEKDVDFAQSLSLLKSIPGVEKYELFEKQVHDVYSYSYSKE